MKMLPKINACQDFSNSSSGFYSTLRDAFNTLAKEEELACEWQDIDPLAYPGFGNADDDYNSRVRSFYSAWSSFATQKTFAWMDVYRYSDAPERRVRRLMEKENKRLREDAAREFNDAVRSLVAFVKKRDPRFKPNAQSELERQKVLRDAAAAQAARSRAANQAKAINTRDLPHWTRTAETEASEESEASEEDPREIYECIMCDKTFKSEKQFEVHERSKRHIKATQQIRREMQEEHDHLNLEENEGHDNGSTSSFALPASHIRESDDPQEIDQGLEALSFNDATHLRRTKVANSSEHHNVSVSAGYRSVLPQAASASTSDDEYAERQAIEDRILNQPKDLEDDLEHHAGLPDDLLKSTYGRATPGSDNTDDVVPERKVGKAKAKRARKAARKSTGIASVDAQVSLMSGLPCGNSPTVQFKCVTCQAAFPSKTRLFSHIKDHGHAQLISKSTAGGKAHKK